MTGRNDTQEACNKVEEGYNFLGKKWVGIIIHTLSKEPKRFSEILGAIPDLSKRMLNERMKELEDYGIVIRNVITDRPVRTQYSLTRKGNELGVTLRVFEKWAEKWM